VVYGIVLPTFTLTNQQASPKTGIFSRAQPSCQKVTMLRGHAAPTLHLPMFLQWPCDAVELSWDDDENSKGDTNMTCKI